MADSNNRSVGMARTRLKSKAEWKQLIHHKRGYWVASISREEFVNAHPDKIHPGAAFESESYGNGRLISHIKYREHFLMLKNMGFDMLRDVFFVYDSNSDRIKFWQSPDLDVIRDAKEEGVLPKDWKGL